MIMALNLAGELVQCDPGSTDVPTRTVVGHQAAVSALTVVPGTNGNFVTGGKDGKVILWRMGSDPMKISGEGDFKTTHNNNHTAIAGIGACVSGIYSVGFDDKLVVSSGDASAINAIVDLSSQPICLASSHGGLVAVGTMDYKVTFYRDGTALFDAEIPDIGAVALLNEEEIAVASLNTVLIFAIDLASGALVQTSTLPENRGKVTCLSYSPSGEFLAVGDASRECKVFNRGDWSPKVSGKWLYHTAGISCLAWNPTGQFIATGGMDNAIFVWNLENPNGRKKITMAHIKGVTNVKYLNDYTIVSTGNDGCIAMFDTTNFYP